MHKTTQIVKLRAAAQAATGSANVPGLTAPVLSGADITCREGWTKAAIAKFLAGPDVTEKWHYPGHGSGLRYLYNEA
jgi:hypothetical protein